MARSSKTSGAALGHLPATGTAAALAVDAPAVRGALTVALSQVLNFRARATRLDRRMTADAYREAAYGGLQDTVPRAALTALHARLEAVGPASWEAPALCQIWFRCSDYVIPREDFDVFTLGALPREPELRTRQILLELPATLSRLGYDPALGTGFLLRAACATARYRIRWDARTVVVIPAAPGEMDPDQARLELARRFLGWHGPATAAQFAKWAGVSRMDAAETWARLAPELITVAVDGRPAPAGA